jgi:MFS family permease
VNSWARERELMRDRPFFILFLCRTISQLGSAYAPVALAFAVLHLPDGSASKLSLILACESIPMVAFLLVGGVLADHFPRKRVLMIGESLSAVAFTALGAMMLAGVTEVWERPSAGRASPSLVRQ